MNNPRRAAKVAPDAAPAHYRRSPLFFLLSSVFIQLLVIAAVVAVAEATKSTSGVVPVLPFSVQCALFVGVAVSVGWGVAMFLELPTPWRCFNALLLPIGALGQLLAVPGWVYLLCAGAALVLYLPTTWTRVPYYPTSQAMYAAVLRELPPNTPVQLVDLGCGFGGLLCYLARRRPESTFVGVELSPLAYLLAQLRVKLLGLQNVSIQFRNLWHLSLSDFSVVYAFLAPPPMAALWNKASQELVKGSLLLVNSFPVPGVEAQETPVPGQRQVKLYRYQL